MWGIRINGVCVVGADNAWNYYGDQLQSNDDATHAAVGGLLAHYAECVRSSPLVRTVPLGLLRIRKAGVGLCSCVLVMGCTQQS